MLAAVEDNAIAIAIAVDKEERKGEEEEEGVGWWERPSRRQLCDLYWHSARGTPGSNYPIVEYLHGGCRSQPAKRWRFGKALGVLRDELGSPRGGGGGEGGGAVGEDCSRRARLLETRLLVGALLEERPDDFDDHCEELAIHFSVDVAIPGLFIEWLHRIGKRALDVLEVLGFGDEDDDSVVKVGSRPRRGAVGKPDDHLHGDALRGDHWKGDRSQDSQLPEGPVQKGHSHDLSRLFASSPRHRTDSPAIVRIRQLEGDTPPTPGKRRKLSLRRDNKVLDRRFQVEFDSPTALLYPSSTTIATPPLSLPPARKKTAATDGTIVLETPPKVSIVPSRSSTPGCSQKIQSLSLEAE